MNNIRKNAIILNVVIALISVMAIVCYFVAPLWKAELSVSVTKEFIELVKGNSSETSEKGESDESDGELMNSVLSAIKEKDIRIPVSFSLSSAEVLSIAITRNTSSVRNVMEKNIDAFLENISDVIAEIADATVKTSVKAMAKEQINEAMSSIVSESDETELVLREAGVTDEYLDTRSEEVLETLKENGVTADDVAAVVLDILDDVEEKIIQTGNFDDDTEIFTDEDRESIKEYINDFFANFTDDFGEIDVNAAISDYLSQLVGENDENAPAYSSNRASSARLTSAYSITDASANKNDGETSSEEDLREKIKAKMLSAFSEETLGVIVIPIMILGILLALSVLSWIYIIIKILVKIPASNPAIKLKVPIIFGWEPFFCLVAVPSLSWLILKGTFADIIASSSATLTSADVLNIFGGIKLSFFSSGVFALAGAAALVVIYFFYGRLRKKL